MQVFYNLLCEFINLASRNFMTAEASQKNFKNLKKAIDKYPIHIYFRMRLRIIIILISKPAIL
jgi:hypothetical protein